MKRFVLSGMSLLFAAGLFAVAVGARYHIDLRDGGRLYAMDRPVPRGSLLLFHQYPGGRLTSVPQEEVVAVASALPGGELAASARGVLEGAPGRPLQPGEAVDVGETGGGAAVPAPATAAYAPGQPSSGAGYGTGAYGGAYVPRSPNGQFLVSTPQLAAMNAAAAQATSTSVAPNGFPATTTGPTTIGPDGTPILTPQGSPGSVIPSIGPNGMPIIAPPGAPGAASLAIGSNGTPILAPAGAPGSAAPQIGPNGTPILAPAGFPGSTFPTIGPNGTPVLAPAGTPGAAQPVLAPNGTPAVPAPGTTVSASPRR